MSVQKDLMLGVAAALEAGDLARVGEWFTEDFRLHDPAFRDWPGAHEGARRMLASIRDLIPGGLRVEVLDMVEEGDRVAARWRFSGHGVAARFVQNRTLSQKQNKIRDFQKRSFVHVSRLHDESSGFSFQNPRSKSRRKAIGICMAVGVQFRANRAVTPRWVGQSSLAIDGLRAKPKLPVGSENH